MCAVQTPHLEYTKAIQGNKNRRERVRIQPAYLANLFCQVKVYSITVYLIPYISVLTPSKQNHISIYIEVGGVRRDNRPIEIGPVLQYP